MIAAYVASISGTVAILAAASIVSNFITSSPSSKELVMAFAVAGVIAFSAYARILLSNSQSE